MKGNVKSVIPLLLTTIMVLSTLMIGCGKSEAVKSVETLISEIDEDMTIESAETIMKAQSAYDQLSESEQKKVGTANKLMNAKEKLDTIAAEKKKDEYEKIKSASIQVTGEMTYLLIAWDYTNNAPNYKEVSRTKALETINSYLPNYEKELSIFNIKVTDDDILNALIAMVGDADVLYKNNDRSKGLAKDVVGTTIATNAELSVGIARHIYESKDPFEMGFDYEKMKGEALSLINSLSFLEGDTEYKMLKDAYGALETVIDNIEKVPQGDEKGYETHLQACRDAVTSCAEVFGKTE